MAWHRFADYRLFFQEFRRTYQTTGAIAPSSQWLAKSMCRQAGASPNPQRILEVGPGTGAVTNWLVRRIRPIDRLDLVELNDRFVDALRVRFDRDPEFQAVAPQARLLHQRIQDLPLEPSYDVIISGLPLNNFASADVEQILENLRGLLKPGGTLSFFQYIAIRRFKAVVSDQATRQRLNEIGRITGALFSQFEFRRDWIWPNLPPAWVHHLRFTEHPDSSRQ